MNPEMWTIVKEKFGTDAAFGLAIGWIPQKISKMKHGKYIPTISEAVSISIAMGVSLDRVASFF